MSYQGEKKELESHIKSLLSRYPVASCPSPQIHLLNFVPVCCLLPFPDCNVSCGFDMNPICSECIGIIKITQVKFSVTKGNRVLTAFIDERETKVIRNKFI